jgi:hypothetical protein
LIVGADTNAGIDTGWHPHLWHPFVQAATADPPLRVVRGEHLHLLSTQGV